MVQGRLASLALLLALAGVLWLSAEAFKKSGVLRIRRIPGLDAIDEMVGRVTEMGRPLAFVLGGTTLEAQRFASMRILDHVAGQSAKYDARLFVVAPLPEDGTHVSRDRESSLPWGGDGGPTVVSVMYMPGDGSRPGC